ncbi:MAG: hypothetical protein AAFU41_13870 [Pseudomonadota bacterium]
MKALIRRAVHWIAQPSRRNAERLWLHYCVALLFVTGLIVLTHALMTGHLQRGLDTAEQVTHANQQAMLADSLTIEAGRVSTDTRASLETYAKLLTSFALLSQQNTDETNALGPQINAFLNTARAFVVAPVPERAAIHAKLQKQLDEGGLRESLLQAGLAAAQEMHAGANGFARIQGAILLASVIVLVAEAALIFWPAHHTVKGTIAKMRQQTVDLRASQRALRKKQAELEHLLRHDPLTQLPNRTAMTSFSMAPCAAVWPRVGASFSSDWMDSNPSMKPMGMTLVMLC